MCRRRWGRITVRLSVLWSSVVRSNTALEQTETETKRRGKSTGYKLSPVENDSAGWKKENDRCCQHRARFITLPYAAYLQDK